jgi:hypothetical protein
MTGSVGVEAVEAYGCDRSRRPYLLLGDANGIELDSSTRA